MIHFSKYVRIYILISALVIIPGVYSLIRFGLKPAIDFTGGTLIEYQFPNKVEENLIKQTAKDQGIEIFSVQITKQNSLLIRAAALPSEKNSQLRKAVEEKLGVKLTQTRFETVGPTLGRELLQKTILAAILAILAILLYIAWSFRNLTFGVSAIVALLHDLLVLVGIFSLLGHFLGVEVDSLFVTALLTTLSFSVHDTIVVFDRIREIKKTSPKLGIQEASDIAFSETIVRSLNNSLTIIFMLLALVLLGGETIRWFAIALLIGTITGTYSSSFVATPTVVFLHRKFSKTI